MSLGFRVVAQDAVKLSQIVEADGYIWMFWP